MKKIIRGQRFHIVGELCMTAFLVLMICSSAFAAAPWDGTVGTLPEPVDNVYTITTPQELAAVAQAVNSGNSFEGKVIELASDINLNEKNWTPIGAGEVDAKGGNIYYTFQGTFNGKGHKIIGLIADALDMNPLPVGLGLFGCIQNNAEIRNVNVYGTVTDNNGLSIIDWGHEKATIGGICGIVENARIENCTFTGRIGGCGNDVGGIAGNIYGGEITNSKFIGRLFSYSSQDEDITYVGGIVSTLSNASTLSECSFNGSFDGRGSFAGIVNNATSYSANASQSTIVRCHVNATVEGKYDDGFSFAGLVNTNYMTVIEECVADINVAISSDSSSPIQVTGGVANNSEIIRGCRVSGNIVIDAATASISGIVGYNEGILGNTGLLENSTSDIDFVINTGGEQNQTISVGGLVGDNWGKISNCRASGSITCSTGASVADISGGAARNFGTIENTLVMQKISGSLGNTGMIGGIAADSSGSEFSDIKNCVSTCDIDINLSTASDNTVVYAGGVIARLISASDSSNPVIGVLNSSYVGSITIDAGNNNAFGYAGGIFADAYVQNGNIRIVDSISSGRIELSGTLRQSYIGGIGGAILGDANKVDVVNCRWFADKYDSAIGNNVVIDESNISFEDASKVAASYAACAPISVEKSVLSEVMKSYPGASDNMKVQSYNADESLSISFDNATQSISVTPGQLGEYSLSATVQINGEVFDITTPIVVGKLPVASSSTTAWLFTFEEGVENAEVVNADFCHESDISPTISSMLNNGVVFKDKTGLFVPFDSAIRNIAMSVVPEYTEDMAINPIPIFHSDIASKQIAVFALEIMGKDLGADNISDIAIIKLDVDGNGKKLKFAGREDMVADSFKVFKALQYQSGTINPNEVYTLQLYLANDRTIENSVYGAVAIVDTRAGTEGGDSPLTPGVDDTPDDTPTPLPNPDQQPSTDGGSGGGGGGCNAGFGFGGLLALVGLAVILRKNSGR